MCRASYIDPRIFDRYRSNLTIAGALPELGQVEELGEPAHQGAIEVAVLELIEDKVAPELDQSVTDGTRISVRFGRMVLIAGRFAPAASHGIAIGVAFALITANTFDCSAARFATA